MSDSRSRLANPPAQTVYVVRMPPAKRKSNGQTNGAKAPQVVAWQRRRCRWQRRRSCPTPGPTALREFDRGGRRTKEPSEWPMRRERSRGERDETLTDTVVSSLRDRLQLRTGLAVTQFTDRVQPSHAYSSLVLCCGDGDSRDGDPIEGDRGDGATGTRPVKA